MKHQNLADYTRNEIDVAFNATIDFFEQIKNIDMSRMQLQISYAKQIVEAFIDGRENVIVSAPTGFGKSLLAFFLTKFFTLLDYDNKSYLLTSNKFLQTQYQRDIAEFKFDRYVMLKGQANYQCTDNGKSFLERSCINDALGQVASGKTSFKCHILCPYISTRQRAIESEVAIFNYSYWLTSMNKSYTVNPNAPFKPRQFTVFDECHVLGNIVQDMFTVEFNINSFIRKTMNAFMIIGNRLHKQIELKPEKFDPFVKVFSELRREQDDNVAAYDLLVTFVDCIINIKSQYYELVLELASILEKTPEGTLIKTKEETEMFKFFEILINIIEDIGALMLTYSELGKNTMVVQFKENDTKFHKPIEYFHNDTSYTMQLQCTDEAELIKRSALSFTKYGLFMSATIGHIDDWAKQSGITNYIGFDVPQVFDYTPSPIFQVTPMISMSFRDKHENMSKLVSRIVKIVNNHPNERGLVHTGTFEIMKELQKLKHPRILTYSNAAEKEDIIRLLESCHDAVVCGPSLVEGVDLKDDLCRFMVFAKVPYMSLADKLTKRKMEIYKNWYNWVTLSQVLQGLGRPIRNNKDWCITYLLDAGFMSFFKRYVPPQYILNRLKECKYDSLGVEVIDTSEADFEAMLLALETK